MWPDDCYYEIAGMIRDPNIGNCKRCVNRSGCGHKNKKEARWCDKYRPEIKNKKKRKKK